MSALAVAGMGANEAGDGEVPPGSEQLPIQSVESQPGSLADIDVDGKLTLGDGKGNALGKPVSAPQTGVTGEVKKLKASNVTSSKPLVNNHPLLKDNLVSKTNEAVSGGSNAKPSSIRCRNKNKSDSRDSLQYVKSSKIHRRINFRFLTSWSPGVYEGQVNRRGLPHGHGTLEEGVTFVENEGKVPMKGENGQVLRHRIYIGNWENGLPSKYGRVVYGDKKQYDGFWKRGKPHGFGIETRPDGDIYRGQWENGKRQGYGVRYWPDGQRFGGEWQNGKMHGVGVFVWPSQLQYSGQWLDHKRNGFGFEMHQQEDNSATYEGEWKKGKRHGLGVRIRSCGSTYKGSFVGGKRNKKQNNSIPADKLDEVVRSVKHFDAEAQRANSKTEDIALKESLNICLLRLACDKTSSTSEDLIQVILDMIAVVKAIPGRTLETSDLLKQGKQKRERLGKLVWNKDVAKHFGLLLKSCKQRHRLIENNRKETLQVVKGSVELES